VPDNPAAGTEEAVILRWTLRRAEWAEAARAGNRRWLASWIITTVSGLAFVAAGVLLLDTPAPRLSGAFLILAGLLAWASQPIKSAVVWARTPTAHEPAVAVVSRAGLRVALSGRVDAVQLTWSTFEPVIETPRTFRLGVPGRANQDRFFCLPKRALLDPAELNHLRALLQLAGSRR
jgi:hypothetical protein